MAWTAALSLVARTSGFTSMMSGAGNVAKAFGNQVTSSMSRAMMASNLAQSAFMSLTQALYAATQQAKMFSNIASRLNLQPAEVANLAKAADEAGLPLMIMARGMNDIRRVGAGGVTGKLSKDLKEAANLLGLSNKEFKIMASGGKDAIALVADKMRDMEDESQKFLILQKIHGNRNAAMMGQIYEKSKQEIDDMFTSQIVSSNETIAANKRIEKSLGDIRDTWNVFLAWVVARFEWVIALIAFFARQLADVGTMFGKIYEAAKEFFDIIGDVINMVGSFLTGDFDEVVRLFNGLGDKIKSVFSKVWDAIIEYLKSRWTKFINALPIPKFARKAFGLEEDPRRQREDNFLKEAPEQSEEVKSAVAKIKEEQKAEAEKRRWEEASHEKRKEILEERRAMAEQEVEAAKDAYTKAEEERMKAMGKWWVIPPEAYKESEAYLKARAKVLDLQRQEEENEKAIAEAAQKKREEAEKAAEEELKRRREIAQQQRNDQDTLFDAQTELLRRNLEDSEATAVERAQFELAVEQEKMSRLQREMIIAHKEGNVERQRELRNDILGQALALDSASRSVNKATLEAQKAQQDALLGGVAGVGSSLTAVGGGGLISFGPMDLQKAQLNVQRSMNSNLEAIRLATQNRGSSNVTYAPYSAVTKPF